MLPAVRSSSSQGTQEVAQDGTDGIIIEPFDVLELKTTSTAQPQQNMVMGALCTAGVIALWLMAAKVNVYFPALLPEDTSMQSLYLLVRYVNMTGYALLFPVS
eukprot:9229338-Pyramimonas_sp.AAC.1